MVTKWRAWKALDTRQGFYPGFAGVLDEGSIEQARNVLHDQCDPDGRIKEVGANATTTLEGALGAIMKCARRQVGSSGICR